MRLGDFSRKLWVVVRQIEILYRKGGKSMHISQALQTDLRNELRDHKTTRQIPSSVRDNYSTNKGNLKMNTNKFLMKLLMASALLALLFTAACSRENAIKGSAEEALVERGDAIMAVLQTGDLQAVRGMLSRETLQMLDMATYLASGVVDLERLIEQNAPTVASWEFNRATIFTRGGAIRGKLIGQVEYLDGKSGKLNMELEQQDGTWKLCGWTFEH
jgi:hypothetical protein